MNREERNKLRNQILLDGHQKYVDWWLPIDVAAGSPLAPMGLFRFCEFLLLVPDEEWFDKWLDKDMFPRPIDGDERLDKLYMKKYILSLIKKHSSGWIDLHNKGNEFTEIERDEEPKSELR